MLTNAYVEDVYELDHVHTATKQLRVIIFDICEKADLHQVM